MSSARWDSQVAGFVAGFRGIVDRGVRKEKRYDGWRNLKGVTAGEMLVGCVVRLSGVC